MREDNGEWTGPEGSNMNPRNKKIESSQVADLDLSGASVPDARRSQSVRTTFRISKEAIAAKDWISEQYGITQKAAIDHASEVIQSLHVLFSESGADDLLETLRKKGMTSDDRVRRTQVVSRSAAKRLEEVGSEFDIPRDRLLELGLLYAKVLLQGEREKRKKSIEALREKYEHLGAEAEAIEVEAREALGDDDSLLDECAYISIHIGNLITKIEQEISAKESATD